MQLDQDGGADAATRRLPVSLVIDPDPSLRIMKEEIFGPILPVIPYDSLDETLAAINRGERPLALYLYARDTALVDKVRRETISGGYAVNVCAAQGAVADMGFGASFDAFIPPYGPSKHRQIEQMFALRRLQLRIGRWLRPGRG